MAMSKSSPEDPCRMTLKVADRQSDCNDRAGALRFLNRSLHPSSAASVKAIGFFGNFSVTHGMYHSVIVLCDHPLRSHARQRCAVAAK